MTTEEKKIKAFEILKRGFLKNTDLPDNETFFHIDSWDWREEGKKYVIIANYADFLNDVMFITKDEYDLLMEVLNDDN